MGALLFSCDCPAVELRQTTPSKRIALVFDDGPRPTDAEPLLALLAQAGVRVTFCVVGECVQAHPGTARAILAGGHELANHSLTHAHARDLDDASLDREVAEAQRIIRETISQAPRWYWPPYREIDDRVRAAVKRAGLRISEPRRAVSTMDWDRSVAGPEIHRLATTDISDGTMIIFHEWREETRVQLPAILAELRRQGCVFVTMSELRAVRP